jgi:PRA1 family protein 1
MENPMEIDEFSVPKMHDVTDIDGGELTSAEASEPIITITLGDDPAVSGILDVPERQGNASSAANMDDLESGGKPMSSSSASTESSSISERVAAAGSVFSALKDGQVSMQGVGSAVAGALGQWKDERMESVRPWGEFFSSERLAVPGPREVIARVPQNLRYFQSNYYLLFMALSVYTVFTTPGLLFMALCMCGIAFYLLYWRPEPIPLCGGAVVLNPHQKVLFVLAMSVVLCMFSSAAHTLLWILMVAVTVVIFHAILYAPAEEDLFADPRAE